MQWSTDKEQKKGAQESILPVAIGKEYSVSVHAVSVHQKTLTLKY
jgi:hypothetical protein